MYAGDGTNAAARNNIAVGDEAPLECCGGLNNVDYSKVFIKKEDDNKEKENDSKVQKHA